MTDAQCENLNAKVDLYAGREVQRVGRILGNQISTTRTAFNNHEHSNGLNDVVNHDFRDTQR